MSKKTDQRRLRGLLSIILLSLVAGSGSGCSTVKSVFAVDKPAATAKPISDPFGEIYQSAAWQKQNMVLRTKKGERSVEVEIPGATQEISDFVIPMSPAFKDGQSELAAEESVSATDKIDSSYSDQKPTASEREILQKLPQGSPQDDARRQEIESEMGVVPTENSRPARDQSYLARVDRIKQLFRVQRYEAVLIELDQLLIEYQTDPKLHEMKGTVLDRMGHTDLAVSSWKQALRLDPSNIPLKRFIERKEMKRGLASP